MSSRRLVDTNLVVRHLLQDVKEHARTAGTLFDACDRGDVTLVMLPIVLAECVFVLESFYKLSRDSIADLLLKIIASPGVEIEQAEAHANALQRFRDTKIHFVDCVIAAFAAADGLEVASFDLDFKHFSDVNVNVKA